jgi:hypothetical protein
MSDKSTSDHESAGNNYGDKQRTPQVRTILADRLAKYCLVLILIREHIHLVLFDDVPKDTHFA